MKVKMNFLIQIHKLIYLICLSSQVIAPSALSEKTEIRKHAERAMERFKIKLHTTLDEARIRRRRSFMSDGNECYERPTITSRNIYSSSSPVVAWCVLHLGGEEIPFAATEEEIGIYDKKFIPLISISNEEIIYLLLGFQYEDNLWLVTIQHAEDEYSFGTYKYSDKHDFILEDSFALPGESLAMITEVQHRVYLPILSNIDSDSVLNLFIWEKIQFNLIVELPLQGNGKSLASWEMHGIFFVAVSFDNFLKIFRFFVSLKILFPTQQIEQECNIVKHFEVAKNHYLVCSSRNKILLYWWNGARFTEQQEICDVDPAVDIALMNLSNDNVAIVSAKNNRLDIYFKISGSYIKSNEVELFEDEELESVNVWKKTDGFYLLPVFRDYSNISLIHLDVTCPKSSLLQDTNVDLTCVQDLEKVLNDVNDKVKSSYLMYNKIWTKNKSSHIPEVYVKGTVISNRTAKISRISFVESYSLNVQSVSNLIDKLSTKLRSLQHLVRNAVLKSTYQEIYGKFKFYYPIVASSMTISRLSDYLSINGINISTFTATLKKTGTQTVSPKLTFNGGIVKSIETRFLNSKEITDYLLLSKEWEYVRGHLQFKDLSVNNMKVKSKKLNGIILDDIMTTTSPQNITCEKKFHRFSSAFINTNGNISGVNMSHLKKIILKDTEEFGMMLHFTSDIILNNMTVHSINGIDLSYLVLNSVKYLEDQSIQGMKTFTDSVNIKSDLSPVRYINDVKLSHLMTLHTPQTHSNDFEIIDASFKEVKTHSVNGIDLCKEAIRKSGDFRINEKVRFTENIVTDNIILKKGVLLDNVDVSNEVPSLISTEKNIFNYSLEFSNVIVKNNVEISDARIQSLLSKLMNNVWLKTTKAQYVPYADFKVMNAVDLYVNSLNNVPFEEIVLSDQSAVISSDKEFLDVEVQSILLQDGMTVNDVDFTSESLISSIFEKLESFTVNNMVVNGNLDVSTLNSVNISDLMQVEKFQKCYGSKVFNFISVDELIASDLDFEDITGKSFSEYVSDSVTLQPLGHILNKNFHFMSSEEVDIEGFLNGANFGALSKSVVTLNSDQIIDSDIEFASGIEMRSVNINNLNIPNLGDIVCKDRTEKNISHKLFQRIYANEANFATANGVNVSALQNTFLKGKDNWILNKIKFKSHLFAPKIQILSSASIDGVKLGDILKVNGNTNLTSMNLANIQAQNVDIFGKLNGCDLSDVKEFLMKKLSVKTKKFFTNLVVDGNLHVKNALNGLPESSFLDIASSLQSASNLKGSFNFRNVKATQLKFLDVMNGINIAFLLKDAVMSHISQTILGKKSFSKITTSNITVNMLNVTYLNKFNFPLIYGKYLSKDANQMIDLNLSNIRAGKIFIKGSLNRVKLPEDVVLVHSNERITSDVICLKPITSHNMHVSKVNNTDLLQFLMSVVSLKTGENISSALTFVKEFLSNGDLHIINSLHGIHLNDVVKTSNRFLQNVNGNKRFLEELNLMSDFGISGFINDIDLENLSENLCQKNKFEFFEDMVYFAGLKASSLNAANINKIHLESLWAHIHNVEETILDKLDNSTDTINEIKYRLLNIKDNNNGSSSSLAYFELHQILNLGFSLKFLPVLEAGVFGEVYELTTKEIIVWIDQNETCRSFKSLKLTVHSDGTLKEPGRIHGRIFPFSLRVLEEDVQGFKLHVDRAIRCTSENRAADILKTVFTSGNDSVFVMPPSNSTVLDAKLLETEDGIFIVIAYEIKGNGERMHVYKYDGVNDTWIQSQKFHSSSISSFDMIYIDDDSENPAGYLAVTGKDATSGIYLYVWDFDIKEFIFKSNISKLVSTSALWSSTNKDVFLLLAKEKTKVFKNNVWSFIYYDPVEVYVLEDDLKFSYEINIYGISSFDTFKLAGETYVLATSPHLQTVYLLQYRGYSGFQVIQEFSAPGVVSVSVFSSGSDIFLAAASKTGHTRILKCVMRGGSFIQRRELRL